MDHTAQSTSAAPQGVRSGPVESSTRPPEKNLDGAILFFTGSAVPVGGSRTSPPTTNRHAGTAPLTHNRPFC